MEFRSLIKRIIDILGSALGLILLSPFFAVVALGIWISVGRPIFFVQWRPGLGGRPFRMVKFRTMSELRSADGQILSDSERLTRFGALVRSMSLDELPELWNVIRGDIRVHC